VKYHFLSFCIIILKKIIRKKITKKLQKNKNKNKKNCINRPSDKYLNCEKLKKLFFHKRSVKKKEGRTKKILQKNKDKKGDKYTKYKMIKIPSIQEKKYKTLFQKKLKIIILSPL